MLADMPACATPCCPHHLPEGHDLNFDPFRQLPTFGAIASDCNESDCVGVRLHCATETNSKMTPTALKVIAPAPWRPTWKLAQIAAQPLHVSTNQSPNDQVESVYCVDSPDVCIKACPCLQHQST